MSKRLLVPMLCGFFVLCFFINISAQKSQYGALFFNPPKGWEKQIEDDSVIYSKVNGKHFQIFFIYSTTDSAGSAKADFQNDYSHLTSKIKLTKQDKEIQIYSEGGNWVCWKFGFHFLQNGVDCLGTLQTFSDGQQTFSVIYMIDTENEDDSGDAFLDSLSVSGASPQSQSTVSNTSSIVGNWSRNGASIASYVSSSGSYVGDASLSSDIQYIFKSNGRYEYYRINLSSSFSVLIFKEGTYRISGNQVTLTPDKSSAAYPPGWKLVRDNYLTVETFQWKVGAAPYNGYPPNCLHLGEIRSGQLQWEYLRPGR